MEVANDAIVVQKFGGSSLSSIDKIRHVAHKVARTREAGRPVVVVVSAMGDTTSELLEQAKEISTSPSLRELDMLLSSGERMTMPLLAMALQQAGHDAISLTGPQSGILTDGDHANATIREVRPHRVVRELEAGRIVIVAGYQGQSEAGEVTTLGRGGSDTTAVALAGALGAEACEIYSDVAGVYTADPRTVENARHLRRLDSGLMYEYAGCGARVLHAPSLELARSEGVTLRVLATFGGDHHTTIECGSELEYSDADDRTPTIVGIGSRAERIRVQARNANARSRAAVLAELEQRGGARGSLEQARSADGCIDVLIGSEDVPDPPTLALELRERLDGLAEVRDGLASVSVVAEPEARRHLARRVDEVLRHGGVEPLWGAERPMSVTRAVQGEDRLTAIRALHEAFVEERSPTPTSARDRDADLPPARSSAGVSPAPTPETREGLLLRKPDRNDGADVARLATRSGSLDRNSPYAYMMWCDRFADASMVAEIDGSLAGFACGFRAPDAPDVLFIWQIGVASEHRGKGIAARLLAEIVEREEGIRYVEATVTPSNAASRQLFRSLATRLGCPCQEKPYFGSDEFPGDADHEPETLFRIGPVRGRGAEHPREQPLAVFEELESEVRSYVRSFPRVFTRARGCELFDESGQAYLDFFAGAGALNYGHNHPRLKRRLLDYLRDDGIVHSLDMATAAKRRLIERFREVVLEPRGLSYKLLFPGPTGTNAVEAALKLTRKATGRHEVYAFEGAFHGMTLGSLSITANPVKRDGAGLPLEHARLLPYDGQTRDGIESIPCLEHALAEGAEQDDLPAAIVLETIQCEGGVKVARDAWLRRVAELCHEYGVLLVVDDIQAGCGRTGSFFSFEEAGIRPDIVCLSKSLSGLGLPLSLVLLREELDVFEPGEHNGTFRGHNPAFVSAVEALAFWEDETFGREVKRKGELLRARLEELAGEYGAAKATVRGRGLVQGLVMGIAGLAGEVARECFERGLVIETAGHDDEVLKCMPPLTIDSAGLERGLSIVKDSLEAALAARDDSAAVSARSTG